MNDWDQSTHYSRRILWNDNLTPIKKKKFVLFLYSIHDSRVDDKVRNKNNSASARPVRVQCSETASERYDEIWRRKNI